MRVHAESIYFWTADSQNTAAIFASNLRVTPQFLFDLATRDFVAFDEKQFEFCFDLCVDPAWSE